MVVRGKLSTDVNTLGQHHSAGKKSSMVVDRLGERERRRGGGVGMPKSFDWFDGAERWLERLPDV